MGLDRTSDTPLYRQLRDALADAIYSGTWRVGDRIPSESELIAAYGVSRTVVRAALGELANQGLVRQIQGKGTFVIENRMIERSFQEFKGFYEQMAAIGIDFTTKVLAQCMGACSRRVCKELDVPWGTTVVEIERLRLIGDEPRYIVTNYIPYELCPGLVSDDLTNQSLYQLMEQKYGIELLHGKRAVRAVPADDRKAELLDVEVSAPLILLEGTSYSCDGRAVEFFRAYHRGDRATFTYEVHRGVRP
jgi:GntR family transcriptional regulator